MAAAAIEVESLAHRYGDRLALDDVTFSVERGEVFGFLGPNGGGKTTLFRILSTLLSVQAGQVRILGADVSQQAELVRRQIGVTFQSPSLDPRLTVFENVCHQGRLFGLWGGDLRRRCEQVLDRVRLLDRRQDVVESLSGGMKRRVEIAKGLLHDPQVLMLDEPSTGLDPGARIDLWHYLETLRGTSGVTILVTTHLMDEAERCDRLGILSRGKLVAEGTPAELKQTVGGDCLTIQSADVESLAAKIERRFHVPPKRVAGALRIERERGHELLRDLMAEFSAEVTSVTLGKPTLEDVFIDRTGHRFWEEDEPAPVKARRRR